MRRQARRLARQLLRRMHFSSRDEDGDRRWSRCICARYRWLSRTAVEPRDIPVLRDTGEPGPTRCSFLAGRLHGSRGAEAEHGWLAAAPLAIISHILRRRMEDPSVISPVQLLRGDDLMTALGLVPGQNSAVSWS